MKEKRERKRGWKREVDVREEKVNKSERIDASFFSFFFLKFDFLSKNLFFFSSLLN